MDVCKIFTESCSEGAKNQFFFEFVHQMFSKFKKKQNPQTSSTFDEQRKRVNISIWASPNQNRFVIHHII